MGTTIRIEEGRGAYSVVVIDFNGEVYEDMTFRNRDDATAAAYALAQQYRGCKVKVQ